MCSAVMPRGRRWAEGHKNLSGECSRAAWFGHRIWEHSEEPNCLSWAFWGPRDPGKFHCKREKSHSRFPGQGKTWYFTVTCRYLAPVSWEAYSVLWSNVVWVVRLWRFIQHLNRTLNCAPHHHHHLAIICFITRYWAVRVWGWDVFVYLFVCLLLRGKLVL